MAHQARGPEALLDVQSWVLDVNWMHVSEVAKIEESNVAEKTGYVSANTGVAGMIPAWRIKQLLDTMKPGVGR
jgi:hypothetical protein